MPKACRDVRVSFVNHFIWFFFLVVIGSLGFPVSFEVSISSCAYFNTTAF